MTWVLLLSVSFDDSEVRNVWCVLVEDGCRVVPVVGGVKEVAVKLSCLDRMHDDGGALLGDVSVDRELVLRRVDGGELSSEL